MTTMLTHPGTPAEMLADLLKRKKRAQRRRGLVNDKGQLIGEGHHRARFTDHECDLMCELRESGMHYKEIARKMECSVSQAWYVCNGQRRAQTPTGQR